MAQLSDPMINTPLITFTCSKFGDDKGVRVGGLRGGVTVSLFL